MKDRRAVWPFAALVPAIASTGIAVWILVLAGRHTPALFDAPRPRIAPAALVDAVSASDVSTAHAMIQLGQNPNEPARYRNRDLFEERRTVTPLFVAVAEGDVEMTTMLLGAGVDIFQPGNLDSVCIGARTGRHECLKLLARAGVDLAAPSCDGRSPADVARQFGHEETASLIERKARFDP